MSVRERANAHQTGIRARYKWLLTVEAIDAKIQEGQGRRAAHFLGDAAAQLIARQIQYLYRIKVDALPF